MECQTQHAVIIIITKCAEWIYVIMYIHLFRCFMAWLHAYSDCLSMVRTDPSCWERKLDTLCFQISNKTEPCHCPMANPYNFSDRWSVHARILYFPFMYTYAGVMTPNGVRGLIHLGAGNCLSWRHQAISHALLSIGLLGTKTSIKI